jgi:hypothetical protein
MSKIRSRFGLCRLDNDHRPGKLPLSVFLGFACLITQWPILLEPEIRIQFDQLFRIIARTNIDICLQQVSQSELGISNRLLMS